VTERVGVCSWCHKRVTDYILTGMAPAVPEVEIEEETQVFELCSHCIPRSIAVSVRYAATVTLVPVDRYIDDMKLIQIEQKKQHDIHIAAGRQVEEIIHRAVHPDHEQEPVH
jgi:hypothetical protein